MPVNAALAGADVTNLNTGPAIVKTYLSAVANAVYATASVLSTINFPVAGISVYGTSANWLTVPRDATVMITDSGGTVVRGYYRTRLDQAGVVTTANLIYLNEIGQGDPGFLAQDIRMTSIQPNDIITVFQRWDGQSVLPRIVYSSGTSGLIFEDFDRLITTENSFPGPATSILVQRLGDTGNGMPGAWAWRVDSGQTYATLRFNAGDIEWPTAGAVSYQWTVPASWTSVTGATTVQLTARAPAQSTNHILKLVVTEANGGSTTRYIPIWVYDFATYNPLPIAEIRDDSRDRTGRRMTLQLNDNGLASIPDGTLVCVWQEATWNGANVWSAARFFNGFVSRESRDMQPGGLRSAEIEVVGPAAILEQINANSQYLTAQTGAPANWQQLSKSLSYIDFLIYWIWSRRTTLCYVFDYCPLGINNTTYRMQAWDIPTGSPLTQMQGLAARVGANVGADSGGQIVVRQNPCMIDYSTRAANSVTRDALNAALYQRAAVTRTLRPRYRRTRGEAFVSDAVTATPCLSDAPDTVPGQGLDEDVMPSQIVQDQNELNLRTGMRFAYVNNPFHVSIEIPYNRDVIEPAHMAFIALTVPANLDPAGVGFTKNVLPESVNKTYGTGGASLTIEAEMETAGIAGRSVTVPVANTTMNGPYSPLPPTLPAPTSPVTRGGQTVIVLEASGKIGLTTTFSATSKWTNITGTGISGTFWQIRFDPFSDFLGPSQSGNLGAYIVASTGLYYCVNMLAPTPVWTLKQNFTSMAPLTRGVIRPSSNYRGVIYVQWANDPGGAFASRSYIAKLSSYGATSDWFVTLGDLHNGGQGGFDIDNYGSDECLVGVRDFGLGVSSVYRILNGVATRITSTDVASIGNNIDFIQKPLTRFGGGSNSGTGSTEDFIYAAGSATRQLKYTQDGGSTLTDITPGTWASDHIALNTSSIVATDNSNYIAFGTEGANNMFVTTNKGAAWTNPQTGNTELTYTTGYFPRLVAGQHALYSGGSLLGYSADFGTTYTNCTGTWTSDIGAISGFYDVIPLY